MKATTITFALLFTSLCFAQNPVSVETGDLALNQTKAAEISFKHTDNYYSFSTNGQGWMMESTLVLYDAAGRVMLERRLLPNEQSGDLPPLDPGICFYRLIGEGKNLVNGKFVVH